MKKYYLFLLIFFASCAGSSENSNVILEIDSDTNQDEASESINNSNDKVIEYPADFDIDTLFECLSDNGVNPIPSPEFNNNNILITFDDGYSQEFIDNFKSVSSQCEEKMKNMSTSSNSSESSEDSNYEVFETNNEFECKKAFYSDLPTPIEQDSAFNYYKYYWQGNEKICYNFYEEELIDDEWEKTVINLFDFFIEELGIYVPINLTLVDQNKASEDTLRQINLDDCSIYDFLKETDIENCADNRDPWGNRFAAAGVDWRGQSNGGNVALFVDNWENSGRDTAIKTFAHEYFHVHQNGLIYLFEEENLYGIPKAWLNNPEETIFNDNPDQVFLMPNWFEEGGAEFIGLILATQYDNNIDARKFFEESLNEARNVISVAASNNDIVSLKDYEYQTGLFESYENPNNGIPREFAYQYTGGQWAHLYLMSLEEDNFEKLAFGYYRNWAENESKNPGKGWETTFEQLFGMSLREFYKDFDTFMLKDKAEQMSILPSNKVLQSLKFSK